MTQYRFTIQHPGGRELIVRDFDIYNVFDWVPLAEGAYKVSVFVRDLLGVRNATESYYVNSKVTGKDAAISEIQHPLVALYSVPPCKFSQKVRVRFRPANGGPWQSTPYKMCLADRTTNFLVAGMKPETSYEMQHEIVFGW